MTRILVTGGCGFIGHDLRYALDGSKMLEMGWRVPVSFDESLEKTVRWFLRPDKKRWLGL